MEVLLSVLRNSNFAFCIQLFAAELLAFLGKKPRKFGRLVFFVGFAVSVTVAVLWKTGQSFSPMIIAIMVLKYTVLFAICIITMHFSFDNTIMDTWFYGIVGYTMQHLAASIAWLFGMVFFRDFIMADFMRLQYFTFAVCASEYPVVYFTLLKRGKNHRIRVGATVLIIPSALMLLISVTMNFALLGLRVMNPVIEVYHITFSVIILFLLSSLFKNGMLSEEKKYISYMLETQKMYKDISQASIETINIKCHDMKKQLETIKKITSQDKLIEYKAEIESSISDYDLVANTGNEALNIILTERSIYCQSKKIKFGYMADGELLAFMSSVDVYSMFGNALDNCIEAVMKVEEKKRIIGLKVVKEQNMVCIHFENFFVGGISVKNGLPPTSKDDAEQHGFGLKSIKMIVQKYGGSMSLSAENDIFYLNILLPLS